MQSCPCPIYCFPGWIDTFGYLPRGFAGMISDVDRREAFAIGRYAVEAAEAGSGSVAMMYEPMGMTRCRRYGAAASV